MPADLDQHDPEMDMPSAETGPEMGEPAGEVIGTHGATDREGAMAKADLFKLANYSHKLYQQINDDDQLEAWVQAKITKAADYIASVYHYLEYEMKFSEYGHHLDNSDTLSEGQKMKIKELLAEAKDKVKELKKADAEKMKGKHEHKVEEGFSREQPCTECGGTGKISMPVPEATKNKVEKYKKLVKATHAAHKRMDANHNGIPDEDEVEEGFEADAKTGSQFKTHKGNTVTKTDTGLKNERPSSSYDDGGDDMDTNAKSGKGIKSHAKAKDSATKKAEKSNNIKLPKHSGNTWGMKGGEKFGQKMEEAAKLKGKQHKLDVDHDGDIEADDLADLRAGKKVDEEQTMSRAAKGIMKYGKKGMQALRDAEAEGKDLEPVRDKFNKYDESAPSAGLSKAKKSAVVKDAKAGKDIGKPGKGFDKLAKKAGGGEKGEKIAAAAMWKNIKETTAYIAEKTKAAKPDFLDMDKDGDKKEPMKKAVADKKKEAVKESSDLGRLQELTGRLNRTEKPTLVENREVDQIRALTQRLLG
jgi:hypothetical protein